MLAARAYMRLKQPSEALGLFREVERLVKPETDLAFQASYYRLLCFFQIEGRHVPDQVDAFLQLYRKSRPDGYPHPHRPHDEGGNPFLEQGSGRRRQGLQRNQRHLGQREKPPGPALSARLVPRPRRATPREPSAHSASSSAVIPRTPRVPSALAKRAKAYAESAEPQKAIADFDRLTAPGHPADLTSFAWLESARMRRGESNIPDMITRYQGLLKTSETSAKTSRPRPIIGSAGDSSKPTPPRTPSPTSRKPARSARRPTASMPASCSPSAISRRRTPPNSPPKSNSPSMENTKRTSPTKCSSGPACRPLTPGITPCRAMPRPHRHPR